MPCNTEHMEPTVRERQKKEAATLLVFALNGLGKPVRKSLQSAASSLYGNGVDGDEVVAELCATIRVMTPKQRDAIVYNGRVKMSRRLADWWEEHQAEDIKREALERKALLKKRYPNHVFVVRRNNDMTEGRGPMVLDCIFADADRAIDYICGQSGVMGTKSALRHNEQIIRGDVVTAPDTWTANDHSVTPMVIK
ncbi:hypothetical protein DSS3P8_182 [Roseobacter phage DSS3P8]|nr:hypothetical protein DSS3P8_182 [Roseobacter phage DSS3P8]